MGVAGARAAASNLLDEHWLKSGERDGGEIDHGAWDTWLGHYSVLGEDGIVRMRYGEVGSADRALLADYVASLTEIEVTSFRRQDQLAYWVNLYNALTVTLILDAYPVDSIRDINDGLFSFGPWDRKLVEVEGRSLSLNDIEHGILRPIWRDPRVHYAVNCASIGCPNLGRSAWRGAAIDAALDQAARAYVNHPRGAHFDSRGRLIVSSIYVWFEEDFGGSEAGVLAHLAAYADEPLKTRLQAATGINADDYDWSLNDAALR